MSFKSFPIFIILALLFLTACDGAGVNRSLSVADGESRDGGLNTVNGSIRIGTDAAVDGSSRTVNGRISVRDGSKVGGLATVNGSIEVARNVEVDGDMESVNGSVDCATGTQVKGDISSINGSLFLEGTVVSGKIQTHNGSVTLRDGSRIEKDVVIARTRGTGNRREIEIKIEGAIVEGDVIVEDPNRKVTVYLSDGGEVRGEIKDAEVVHEAVAGL
ncbi:MAG: hypothetical protein AAF657_20685 [Acidobacteriota bacterium]